MPRTVLVADDERPIRELVSEVLLAAGYDVRLASNGLEALDQVVTHHPDLLLTDFRMPYLDGLNLIARLREQNETLPILLMSAAPPEDRNLPVAVISKPFDIPYLVDAVAQALDSSVAMFP